MKILDYKLSLCKTTTIVMFKISCTYMFESLATCIHTSFAITKYYIYISITKKTKSRTYIRRTPNDVLALTSVGCP